MNTKKIDDEIFIALYKDGLTLNEIASVFNVNPGSFLRYTRKYNLKREKPKPDYDNRYGKSHSPFGISRIKRTLFKKCLNPDCDYYYYGHRKDKYCCPSCRVRASNIKNRDARNEWNRIQRIKAKSMGERWDGKHKVLLDCEKLP